MAEGNIKIGSNTLPSFDLTHGGVTGEIRQTEEYVKGHYVKKVSAAIGHSLKESKVADYVIQASVAVHYTKNVNIHEREVLEGIKAQMSRKKAASPKYLLQIDAINRKVYAYKIK